MNLIFSSALTVALSVAVCLIERQTSFSRLNEKAKQIIIGVAFGMCACACNFVSVNIGTVSLNVRDAAPLCAGLLFSPEAGIVSGIIAAAGRFAMPFGSYTRIACSVSALLAGLFSAWSRKVMFDNKKPPLVHAFFIGVTVQILDMLLILLTNIKDPLTAFEVVKSSAVLMALVCGVTTTLSVLCVKLLIGEKPSNIFKEKTISRSFQFWLMICVSVAFASTVLFTVGVQTELAKKETEDLFKESLSKISGEISRSDKDNLENAFETASLLSVGTKGKVLVLDNDFVILSGENAGQSLEKQISRKIKGEKSESFFKARVQGADCYCMYVTCKDKIIFAFRPSSEVMFHRTLTLYVTVFTQTLIFVALFVNIYMLIKRLIVNNLKKVNDSLAEITNGNLNTVVNVRSHSEFASLSDDINHTVESLKHYIAQAAARIDKELEFAKTIQHSSLPEIFPPFPGRKDFDIFALMDTAKEVGGDFYDFYFVGDDVFSFLIADVSGKGIPAAMFMMKAKTLIKNLAQSGIAPEEVFEKANNELCQNNEADMFVTAWMGTVNLKSGELTVCNAGHNAPVLLKANGTCDFLKTRPGFVLAGMENVKYKPFKIKLDRGDKLLLYTDGVTEAFNKDGKMFGNERLLDVAASLCERNVKRLCKGIEKSVFDFSSGTDQSDDLTAMAFVFNGGEPM